MNVQQVCRRQTGRHGHTLANGLVVCPPDHLRCMHLQKLAITCQEPLVAPASHEQVFATHCCCSCPKVVLCHLPQIQPMQNPGLLHGWARQTQSAKPWAVAWTRSGESNTTKQREQKMGVTGCILRQRRTIPNCQASIAPPTIRLI